jgi:hypothetical protein
MPEPPANPRLGVINEANNQSESDTSGNKSGKSGKRSYGMLLFGRSMLASLTLAGYLLRKGHTVRFLIIFALFVLPSLALAQNDDAIQQDTSREMFVGLQTMLLGIGLNPPSVEVGVALGNHVSIIGYMEANTLNLFSEPVEKSNGEFETRYGSLGLGARYSPWAGSFFTETLLSVGVKQYYETLYTAGRNYASDYIRVQGNIGNKWNIYNFSLGMKWLSLGYPLWEDVRVWRISDYKPNVFDAQGVSDMEAHTVQLVSMFDVFFEYRF